MRRLGYWRLSNSLEASRLVLGFVGTGSIAGGASSQVGHESTSRHVPVADNHIGVLSSTDGNRVAQGTDTAARGPGECPHLSRLCRP